MKQQLAFRKTLHTKLLHKDDISGCTDWTLDGKSTELGHNCLQPADVSADKRWRAYQAILSRLPRNEIGLCVRNTVVSKHKAPLCFLASSLENWRQTEDQLQRWKWGQGGLLPLPPPPELPKPASSPLLSSPLSPTCFKVRAARALQK